jgi:proteic killer suppression protein
MILWSFLKLDILFQTSKLEKEFTDKKTLLRIYGTQRGNLIALRLNQLKIASNLAELALLPQIRCHELTQNRKGQVALDLKHPYRLIIEPANDPLPRKPDGGLDWAGVTAVRIIEVINYH